jgi:hypothetical protein
VSVVHVPPMADRLDYEDVLLAVPGDYCPIVAGA